MAVRRHRDRLTALGIALLVVVGAALLPSVASASTNEAPGIIDTGRVIGPLVGPETMRGASGPVGARDVLGSETTFSPGTVIGHGQRIAKSKGSKPLIQKQPSNLSVKSGVRSSFVASAKGSPTPSVQWKESPNGRTWSTIKGATKPTYAFVASARQEGYHFEAVFKNAVGSVTTHSVKLTVISAPLVTLQPSAESVQSGQPASFTAGAAGSPKPSVRWEMSTNGSAWQAIGGATNDVYSFDATLDQSGETFEAIFKNSHGQTRTHEAALTVTPAPIAPVMVTQPVSQTAAAGATVSLAAAATGSPVPTVQWLASAGGLPFAPISGATSPTYSFAASLAQSGSQFEAVFTNVAGSATSSPAALTVEVAPAISAQPVSQTAASGALVSFTAAATGTPAPSVQWQYSTDAGTTWQPWSGQTSTTLSFTATGQQSLYQFEAVFSNAAGQVPSAPATLTVMQGPTLSASGNWSGYADVGSTFTAVSGSWTVPTVTCPGNSTSYSSEWVGVDGYSLNSDATSVEQDGTEMDCIGGVSQYDAWFEMFGDEAEAGGDELELSPSFYPVDPGDVISASVNVVSNTWTLSLTDTSSGHLGWNFSTTVNFTASEASAEWILERPTICTSPSPSSCSLPALANFGNSIFTNGQATSTQGSGPINAFQNTFIEMIGNTDNVLAVPSAVNVAGTSFTDTWSGSS